MVAFEAANSISWKAGQVLAQTICLHHLHSVLGVRNVSGRIWRTPLSSSFFHGILPGSSVFSVSQCHCPSVPGQEDCGCFPCLSPHNPCACHRGCTWLQDKSTRTFKAPSSQSSQKAYTPHQLFCFCSLFCTFKKLLFVLRPRF